MKTRLTWTIEAALAAAIRGTGAAVAQPEHEMQHRDQEGPGSSPIRVATYNASLNRAAAGDLQRDLSTRDNAQAGNIAR